MARTKKAARKFSDATSNSKVARLPKSFNPRPSGASGDPVEMPGVAADVHKEIAGCIKSIVLLVHENRFVESEPLFLQIAQHGNSFLNQKIFLANHDCASVESDNSTCVKKLLQTLRNNHSLSRLSTLKRSRKSAEKGMRRVVNIAATLRSILLEMEFRHEFNIASAV